MTTITIEDVKNITVKSGYIDFEQKNGITRLDTDSEYLMEQLEEFFHKQTFGDMKRELEDKIQELQEALEATQRETAEVRTGDWKGDI